MMVRALDASGVFHSTYFDSNATTTNQTRLPETAGYVWRHLSLHMPNPCKVHHTVVDVGTCDEDSQALLRQQGNGCAFHAIAFVQLQLKVEIPMEVWTAPDRLQAYRRWWSLLAYKHLSNDYLLV
jgi:hypothetical protein